MESVWSKAVLQLYKHKNHDAGVLAYELFDTAIDLVFHKKKGEVYKRYRYSYADPGATHVEAMKAAAKRGSGLTTYKNKFANGERPSRPLTAKQVRELMALLSDTKQ